MNQASEKSSMGQKWNLFNEKKTSIWELFIPNRKIPEQILSGITKAPCIHNYLDLNFSGMATSFLYLSL